MADKVYLHDDPVIIMEFAIAVWVPNTHLYINVQDIDDLDEKIFVEMLDGYMQPIPAARTNWEDEDEDSDEKTVLSMPHWDDTFVGVPLVERRPAPRRK